MDSITVKLGDKDYTIGQLDLGQLRDMAIGVTLPDADDQQERVRRSYDRAVAVISAGLRRDHPEMTPQEIFKIRGLTNTQMREANDAILQYSGLVSVKTDGAPAGEAAGAA
jgi:hypothetical protein